MWRFLFTNMNTKRRQANQALRILSSRHYRIVPFQGLQTPKADRSWKRYQVAKPGSESRIGRPFCSPTIEEWDLLLVARVHTWSIGGPIGHPGRCLHLQDPAALCTNSTAVVSWVTPTWNALITRKVLGLPCEQCPVHLNLLSPNLPILAIEVHMLGLIALVHNPCPTFADECPSLLVLKLPWHCSGDHPQDSSHPFLWKTPPKLQRSQRNI